MKKKKIIKLVIILIIIVAAVLVALFIVKGKNPTVEMEESYQIQMQMVEKKDLSDTISLSGTVTGETKMNYTSNAISTFVTVNVEVGDEVKKGDILATLDKEEVQEQIKAVEKNISFNNAISKNQSEMNKEALEDAKKDQKNQLAEADEAIKEAKADLEEAKKDLASLENDETALEEDIEIAKESVKVLESAYKAALKGYDVIKEVTDDAIKNAQNTIDMEKYSDSGNDTLLEQLDELKKQLEECEIVCKEDGIVISVNAYEGGTNTPGSPIFTVENNSTMIMTASVEETDILKLEEGMKAIVTAKALEDQEISGEVIKVMKVANGSSGSSDMGDMYSGSEMSGFSVQIKLGDSELISGMSAKAKIFLTDKKDVLCVPYDMVQTDEMGEAFVLCGVDNGDGTYTAVKKSITTGMEVDYYTEVTGGDLQEGDLIILDYSIYEGMVFEGVASMEIMDSMGTMDEEYGIMY